MIYESQSFKNCIELQNIETNLFFIWVYIPLSIWYTLPFSEPIDRLHQKSSFLVSSRTSTELLPPPHCRSQKFSPASDRSMHWTDDSPMETDQESEGSEAVLKSRLHK